MSAILLPAIMDKAALAPLAREMNELCERAEPLRVDGARVTRIGLAGLQLLASAALNARDRGVAFEIADASDELAGAAALGGLGALLGVAAGEA